jgi:8-oxo-dGTP diphosphatase
MDVRSIDWLRWTPRDIATLLFVVRAGQVLLIRKLRGLGAGKINAPGGRLEPGETPLDAAVREVREEVGVTPAAPRARGELRFQFADGYGLHCHVFRSDGCEGEPRESPEAIPLWVPLEQIPYDQMWADDALWLPRMLAGHRFSGRFTFDGDALTSHEILWDDPAAPLFSQLDSLSIATRTREHPPVFTVEQARRHRAPDEGPGAHLKNLFVHDGRGGHWLVCVPEDRALDLRALAAQLGAKRLTFASPARLWEHLAVQPGSVTPFAAFHDTSGRVTVVLDRALASAHAVHCHPLTNDRTTTISGPDLTRWLAHVGHPPTLLDPA